MRKLRNVLYCLGVFLVAGLALAGSAAYAQDDTTTPPACTLASFTGSFGYKLTGYVYDNYGYIYYIGSAGRLVSDANGNISGADTYSFDGTPYRRQLTGTYTINDDCTGSITLSASVGGTSNFDFVIVGNGKEIEVVQTNTPYILTGTLKQQYPATTQTTTPPPVTTERQAR